MYKEAFWAFLDHAFSTIIWQKKNQKFSTLLPEGGGSDPSVEFFYTFFWRVPLVNKSGKYLLSPPQHRARQLEWWNLFEKGLFIFVCLFILSLLLLFVKYILLFNYFNSSSLTFTSLMTIFKSATSMMAWRLMLIWCDDSPSNANDCWLPFDSAENCNAMQLLKERGVWR